MTEYNALCADLPQTNDAPKANTIPQGFVRHQDGAFHSEVFIQDVEKKIAARLGITPKVIYSQMRAESISFARHMLWVLVRTYAEDMSYPKLGKIFNRDHSTIMYGTRQFFTKIEHSKRKRDAFANICRDLRAAGWIIDDVESEAA